MVKEITAWTDTDGKIHHSLLAATEADARIGLLKIDGVNLALANALLAAAQRAVAVLAPYAHELTDAAMARIPDNN